MDGRISRRRWANGLSQMSMTPRLGTWLRSTRICQKISRMRERKRIVPEIKKLWTKGRNSEIGTKMHPSEVAAFCALRASLIQAPRSAGSRAPRPADPCSPVNEKCMSSCLPAVRFVPDPPQWFKGRSARGNWLHCCSLRRVQLVWWWGRLTCDSEARVPAPQTSPCQRQP